MTKSDVLARVRVLREELEARHKYGTIKIASSDGEPIPVKDLQNELYALIYKASKMD